MKKPLSFADKSMLEYQKIKIKNENLSGVTKQDYEFIKFYKQVIDT